jgi:uncharacterized protein
MQRTLLLVSLLTTATFHAAAADGLPRLHAVPFNQVDVRDSFWAPRQETNRLASIPVNLAMLEKSGNIKNMELAAEGAKSGFTGPVFMDSDLYKALEAASYSLTTHPDADLERKLDELIAKIGRAQQPDGYLNTYFTVKEPDKRWTNLRDWHELYCAGHLFEAAVAYFQATGKREFLQIATKLADNIDSVFGPGKRMGYPGHPEIELALVKLSQVTGEKRYFNLARFFIENRGRRFYAEEHKTPLDRYDGSYWQDDVPICDHTNIKGHAVRAAYLLSGATDVAAETGDRALLRMIQRVWRNTAEKNMYITGGIGPSAHNEGFTTDYDLPNLTAYQETCASVALAQWNHRLALLYGDSRYADVFERSLYNGVLAGVSLDGTRFFYVNPLESMGNHHRSPWFGCACCPPNVARTLASLGGYAYATSDSALWVNLFIQGSATAKVSGKQVKVEVVTEYPWHGQVLLKPRLEGSARFDLRLRVPGWCRGATVKVNGENAQAKTDRGYLVLSRDWRTGDEVELNLPMPIERVAANPNVKQNANRLAIQRGPLVYCVEACDQPEPISSLYLPAAAKLEARRDPQLLGGVVVIQGAAAVAPEMDWTRTLYRSLPASTPAPLTAIPYYAWDNRKAGHMQVWLPVAPPMPAAGGLEASAKISLSFVSGNAQPAGLNDGVEPKSSGEQPAALCHWWPHKGGREWAQYTWKQPVTVGGASVYWFDDTGRGECRLPVSWKVEYLQGSDWKPVVTKSEYKVTKDKWCEIAFDPVTTTALRLIVQMQNGWAAGVHEWKLVEAESDSTELASGQ